MGSSVLPQSWEEESGFVLPHDNSILVPEPRGEEAMRKVTTMVNFLQNT